MKGETERDGDRIFNVLILSGILAVLLYKLFI
jgi:hypothetical protein